jgi:hypothetical protein
MFPKSISTHFQGVQLFKTLFFIFFFFLLPQISASLRFEHLPLGRSIFLLQRQNKPVKKVRVHIIGPLSSENSFLRFLRRANN